MTNLIDLTKDILMEYEKEREYIKNDIELEMFMEMKAQVLAARVNKILIGA